MSHDHISKVTSLGKKEDGKEANELLNKACAQVQVSFNLLPYSHFNLLDGFLQRFTHIYIFSQLLCTNSQSWENVAGRYHW